ncbi:MAG: hypothetical protein GEV07_03800 [Streptosporangiales bacterium]|nr:hypothetical protein [Streptosporangiales bacterium]
MGDPLIIDQAGTIEDFTDGTTPTRRIVAFTLATSDYSAGKFVAGETYLGEVETQPGPLTHPEDGNFTITVVADLG